MERCILHVDANSFFASVECLHHPELRDRAVAVGGDAEARHGIILAKNEAAKRCGVKTGEALWQARQKCPELVIRPPDYPQYLRFSRLAREIYEDYSPLVEPFGLDECWVDVSGTEKLASLGGAGLGEELRQRVKAELGITVSVGVSDNKIYAKLGSDYQKPDAVTVFDRRTGKDRIFPLPAGDLLCVGPATARRLRSYGIHTIGQLANTAPEYLQSWFGKLGPVLHCFANGLDPTPVARAGDEAVIKSIGNSTTAPRDLVCEEDARSVFWMLCESVAERLRDGGFLCRTVVISLRTNELVCCERQRKLDTPTCLASELHRTAMELLRAHCDWQKPLRSIGVRAADLLPDSAPVQLGLFESAEQRARLARLERAVDGIRRRYGHGAVSRLITVSDGTLRNIDARSEHTIHPVGYFAAAGKGAG